MSHGLKADNFAECHGNISVAGEDDTDIPKFDMISSSEMDYILLLEVVLLPKPKKSKYVRGIMIDHVLKTRMCY